MQAVILDLYACSVFYTHDTSLFSKFQYIDAAGKIMIWHGLHKLPIVMTGTTKNLSFK